MFSKLFTAALLVCASIVAAPVLANSLPLPQASPVPEPASYLLVGTALIGVAWLRRKKSA